MNVPIDKIKPDKNQPRKNFNEEHLFDLVQSLKQEGMINPIELDPNYVIITGERRWRAARLLGWTEVPVTINSSPMTPYERLRRQIAENFHQSGSYTGMAMSPIDTAKAWAMLFKLKTGTEWQSVTVYSGNYGIMKEISQEVGVNPDTVREYLNLLNEPEFIQKDIEAGRPRSYYLVARGAPPEIRKQIEQKIAAGEFEDRQQVKDIVNLAKSSPDLIQVELNRQRHRESFQANRILNQIVKLGLALEAISLSQLSLSDKQMVLSQLEWVTKKISDYVDERVKNG